MLLIKHCEQWHGMNTVVGRFALISCSAECNLEPRWGLNLQERALTRSDANERRFHTVHVDQTDLLGAPGLLVVFRLMRLLQKNRRKKNKL